MSRRARSSSSSSSGGSGRPRGDSLPTPARPDYGGGRMPTMHSIMFGTPKGKPSSAPSMDKPPNAPQGPHSDAQGHIQKAMRAAQLQGRLAQLRPALDPPIKPKSAMGKALAARREERPARMGVLDAHRLARSNSLDRHEAEHESRLSKRRRGDSTPLPNTEAHFQSLEAATNLNPFSTTHHLGAKPAAKVFTDGKGEASKTFEQAYDRRSVNAFTAQRQSLRAEYDAVHAARAKALAPFLPAVEAGDDGGEAAPASRKRKRGQ